MLYWTCLECGRDCSPAVRECPACAAAAATRSQPSGPLEQHSGVEAGIASLAQTFKIVATTPLLAAPSEIQHLSANGKSGHTPGTATLTSVEVAPSVEEETLSIPAGDAVDSLVRPLVESAELEADAKPGAVGKPQSEAERSGQLEEEAAAIARAEEAKRQAEAEARRAEEEAAAVARARAEEAKRQAEAEIEAARARREAEEQARRAEEEAAAVARAQAEEAKLEAARARREAEEQARRAEEEAAAVARARAEEAKRQAEAEIEAARVRREAEEQARRAEEEAAALARAQAEEAKRQAEAEAKRAEEEAAAAARAQAQAAKRQAELEAAQARLAAEEFARRTEAEAARIAQALSEAVKLQAEAELEAVRAKHEAEESARRAQAEAALTAQAFAEAAKLQAEAELEAARARFEAEESARRAEAEAALTAEAFSQAVQLQADAVLDEIGAQLEAEQAIRRAQAEIARAIQALGCALDLHAESVLLPICAAIDAEQAAIGALVVSFQRSSAAGLLSAPTEILIEPAPPSLEWIRAAKPSIPAQAPADPSRAEFVAQPQPSTLAGPCLPAQFRNLSGLLVTGESRSRRPISLPAWTISVLVAIALFLATGAIIRHFNDSASTSAAETPAAAAVQPASAAARGPQSNALAKALEVSGLRVVNSWNHKPQVEFLLINHSGEELSGMNIQVAVKSAEAFASSTPILNINAFVRSLGPYQSKEIRTELDSDISASTFSDWQSLKTEVQISSGQ